MRLNHRLLAHELSALGFDADCAPCLDLPQPDAHGVIGDRAFATRAAAVAALGRAAVDGLLAGGVAPVIKHIPGHGRARADSHVELPVVETPLAVLEETDFAPFRSPGRRAHGHDRPRHLRRGRSGTACATHSHKRDRDR